MRVSQLKALQSGQYDDEIMKVDLSHVPPLFFGDELIIEYNRKDNKIDKDSIIILWKRQDES